MIKKLVVLSMLVCIACQTTKIKNETYKIATTSPELGSIGQSDKVNGIENNFSVKAFPKLENEIRVGIEIVPFNKHLNNVYASKAKYNQNQTKVAYIDSLPVKPELVTIKILDVNGFVNELNAQYNSDIVRLLQNTKKSQIITSIAVSLSLDDISKVRQADAYYLTNSQNKKYLISLFKSGKKTDMIDINPETIVGYQSSVFCWAISSKRQWYVADIVKDNTNCKGNTKSIIPKEDSKSLFDM
ncbi:hypothetical protein [Flavobacterium sp. HTF]|uniref:hypothetical protein n=1 Tax=Flavobacterium sp. HTF TaxID=2170732 RepID=UPI000D5E0098|nr:hypothetical protein [Flavobacterium sp. HTF]PWB21467.1 hypothetical protein DCO46_19845 [Flavobacterium sp. HTF]